MGPLTSKQKLGVAVVGAGALLLLARKASAAPGLAAGPVDPALFRASVPPRVRPFADPILSAAQVTKISPFLIAGLGDRESQWGTSASLRPKAGGAAAVGDPSKRHYAGAMLETALGLGARGTGSTRTNASGTESVELEPPALGPSGERGWGMGLMQLDAMSYPDLARSGAWTDPAANVLEGARRLRQALDLLARSPGSKPLSSLKGKRDPRPLSGEALVAAALASYNAGEGNVLYALVSGEAPDSATTGDDYGADVARRAREMATAFVAAGGDEAFA